MIFSRALLGTDKEKTKLSWVEYILFSCIQQGWMNCWYSFQNWGDLMGNNYAEYALLKDDDPLEQCILYFWDSHNVSRPRINRGNNLPCSYSCSWVLYSI